jgi:hypothetical protein
MNRTPELSIVMSVYNAERFLDKAIGSILDQQFSDYEFVIVDDASTDSTMNLVQKWAAADDRIKIFRNETRLGLTKSLNRAISQTTAPWIARQDGDDVSHSARLRLQMDQLGKNPDVGVLGTWYEGIDKEGRHLYWMTLPAVDQKIKRWLRTINCLCHGTVIFSKDLFIKAGGYPEKYPFAQDYALWLRFSKLTKIKNIPEVLYQRRIHDGAVSQLNQERWQVLQQLKLDAGLIGKQEGLKEFIAREYRIHGKFLLGIGQYKEGIMSLLEGLLRA